MLYIIDSPLGPKQMEGRFGPVVEVEECDLCHSIVRAGQMTGHEIVLHPEYDNED